MTEAVDPKVLRAVELHVVAALDAFDVDPAHMERYVSGLLERLRAAPAASPVETHERDDEIDFDSLFEAIHEPVVVDAPVDAAPAPFVRRHARFPLNAPVEVELAGRDELKALYSKDISKGGLFLETDNPPTLGSELVIRLSTPDGGIKLDATVVHVMDAAQANAVGTAPGIGVQFTDLEGQTASALEAYVDGLAERLEQEENSTAEDEANEAKTFLAQLQSKDLYAALNMEPDAPVDALLARLGELEARFSVKTEDAQAMTRLHTALRAVERVRGVLSNPTRRLAHDFMNHLTRAEERLAAGADPVVLRGVWQRVFPEKHEKANRLAGLALKHADGKRFKDAAEHAKAALGFDPFLVKLRESLEVWLQSAELTELMVGDESPTRIALRARELGVSSANLRTLWSAQFPDRISQAKVLAQRALQARSVKLLEDAINAGSRAVVLDPFNDQLVDAVASWKAAAAKRAASD